MVMDIMIIANAYLLRVNALCIITCTGDRIYTCHTSHNAKSVILVYTLCMRVYIYISIYICIQITFSNTVCAKSKEFGEKAEYERATERYNVKI